jgi:hypothetical protein
MVLLFPDGFYLNSAEKERMGGEGQGEIAVSSQLSAVSFKS